MIKIPYSVLLEKIKTKTGMSEEAIETQIGQKMEQLSGLISKEGAAHILANELKVDLSAAPQLTLKIRDLYAGMKTGEIVGKLLRKYDVRDFQSGERKGKVGSFLIADETGTMRVTCWNEQTKEMEQLQENDILAIIEGTVRENRGALEVHLNERTKIIRNPEGKNVAVTKTTEPVIRKAIKDLAAQDNNIEILGTIVQVFEPKFFERCPVCRKRIKQQEVGFQCPEHGLTTPDYGSVMNAYVDDGSSNIRVVFFGQQMQQLLKKNEEEVLVYRTTPTAFEKVKTDLLGEMVKVSGRVTKNEMFARLEFVANKIETNVNPEEEITRLQQELEKAQA